MQTRSTAGASDVAIAGADARECAGFAAHFRATPASSMAPIIRRTAIAFQVIDLSEFTRGPQAFASVQRDARRRSRAFESDRKKGDATQALRGRFRSQSDGTVGRGRRQSKRMKRTPGQARLRRSGKNKVFKAQEATVEPAAHSAIA